MDPNKIQQVWEKGLIIPGNDFQIWRRDQCGAWIGRNYYGNRNSEYGWEIDHINPSVGDDLANLRPLQWENNVSKSDGRLTCPVTSQGAHNS